jgi:hypothetical protein
LAALISSAPAAAEREAVGLLGHLLELLLHLGHAVVDGLVELLELVLGDGVLRPSSRAGSRRWSFFALKSSNVLPSFDGGLHLGGEGLVFLALGGECERATRPRGARPGCR